MPMKQWSAIEVGNEIAISFQLSFMSSLDFKPLSVPIEANLGSVSKEKSQLGVINENDLLLKLFS